MMFPSQVKESTGTQPITRRFAHPETYEDDLGLPPNGHSELSSHASDPVTGSTHFTHDTASTYNAGLDVVSLE